MRTVDKHNRFDEEVFTYQETKNGKVFICWHGKQVMTLSGQKAQDFMSKVKTVDGREAQLLMAKVTGNFKRGNERSPSRQ